MRPRRKCIMTILFVIVVCVLLSDRTIVTCSYKGDWVAYRESLWGLRKKKLFRQDAAHSHIAEDYFLAYPEKDKTFLINWEFTYLVRLHQYISNITETTSERSKIFRRQIQKIDFHDDLKHAIKHDGDVSRVMEIYFVPYTMREI